MYRILLRDIITGEKHWYTDCYYNGKLVRNKVIFWKGVKMKVLAWSWQGFDKKVSIREQAITDYATEVLLSLDIPQQWRDSLLEYTNTKKSLHTK